MASDPAVGADARDLSAMPMTVAMKNAIKQATASRSRAAAPPSIRPSAKTRATTSATAKVTKTSDARTRAIHWFAAWPGRLCCHLATGFRGPGDADTELEEPDARICSPDHARAHMFLCILRCMSNGTCAGASHQRRSKMTTAEAPRHSGNAGGEGRSLGKREGQGGHVTHP